MATNLEISPPPHSPGFGDYTLPDGKTFDQMQSAAKLQKIAYAIFFGIIAVCAIALVQVSVPLAMLTSIGLTIMMIKKILDTMGVANRAPPMNDLFPAEIIDKLPKLTEVSNIPCTGFPTEDGTDSQMWKEHLIRSARHSIVLSGCYCGGRVFDKTLGIIAEQMREFPAVKTFILASAIMITPENQAGLDQLSAEFPDRFNCIITPELFPTLSPTTQEFAIASNHTKALVIDYGAYFMVGGTGIVSSFAEQKGTTEPKDLEVKSGCMEQAIDVIFKMRAFRDMDFVFHSELNGNGTRLHVEMMKLFERMRYRQNSEIKTTETNWPDRIEETCDPFTLRADKANGLKIACYATGPEHEKNSLLEEMITQVDSAEKSITIGNLYFHPPKRLFDALVRASNRNVKLTIITNRNGSRSPGSHALYTQRSSYYAKKLFQGKANPNIQLYEYEIAHTSYHKKVMTIDGKITILGSGNLGKKTLENLDYELNLKVESEEFADQVDRSMDKDKALCTKVPDEEAYKIPFITHLLAPLQLVPMLIA